MSRRLFLLAAAGVLATAGVAATKPAKPAKEADTFMPYVELAPFVVNGKQFAISIHARSRGDRRYAEDFAEEVVKVVAEAVTEDTGKGLVIIGKKGEPHPIFVFRKFLALAEAGQLDPAVAARGPELFTMLNHWQDIADDHDPEDPEGDEDVDVEFEKIVTALPLPLEGIGAKLYQLAWAEGFDPAKVETKLRALHAADLEGNLFARFDWVFYLPPRGAFEQALDGIIADALKDEKAGFLERTAVKGALMMVKPFIRKVIEGMRRTVMFSAVVQARTDFSEAKVSSLAGAYMDALMNEHKEPGSEHERAVRLVRADLSSYVEKPKGAEESESEPVSEPEPEPASEAGTKP